MSDTPFCDKLVAFSQEVKFKRLGSKKECPKCDYLLSGSDKFCVNCGFKYENDAERGVAHQNPKDADRMHAGQVDVKSAIIGA